MKRQRGAFSLVEVVLALGVVGFALLAIIGLLPIALQSDRGSIQETRANHLADAVFAVIRSHHLPPSPSQSCKAPRPQIFQHRTCRRLSCTPATTGLSRRPQITSALMFPSSKRPLASCLAELMKCT
jgi:type II secretory pathway pseudopilin PulG